MLRRPPYSPASDLKTETVKVGVSLVTKEALTEAAQRAGQPVSALLRDAVETVIARAPGGRR